ncbi:MAG: 3-methyl-2-oxobutanoate hydroxymethyltransferase, partial [Desulfobulbaceae bacterium]|nr:3-methyl-2-oxobutanoate hydroxymethyltransferase [Desulfobulbaceae bacterium]
TIGIGAGPACDGQVLVTHDLLGLFDKFVPSFVKKYVDLSPRIKEALASFQAEVKSGKYPDVEHSFTTKVDMKALLRDSEDA